MKKVNKTIDLIEQRVSLRKFADRKISCQVKNQILHSTLRAPTAGNMMLYSIIDVVDQHKKEVLSRSCDNQPFIAKAPLVLIFLADFQRWYDYYKLSDVKNYCKQNGKEFIGPTEADLMLGCSDALIAAQTAVLAAESLEIGSCYIGDIMENYETHRELFELPEWTFPVAMLVMGYYPDNRPTPRPRFNQEYIVTKDIYHKLTDAELQDLFAERSQRFKPDNSLAAQNFGQFMYGRKTGADFSAEMARSVKKFLKHWQGEKL